MESDIIFKLLIIFGLFSICIFGMEVIFYGDDIADAPNFEYLGRPKYTLSELNQTRAQLENQGYSDDDIDILINNMALEQKGLPAWWDLPGWVGLIGESVSYIFGIIGNLLTFNVPNLPLLLRLLFMVPMWIFVGLVIYFLFMQIGSAIASAI